MPIKSCLTIPISFFFCLMQLYGQSLIGKLPEDGTWAKYRAVYKTTNEDGTPKRTEGLLTIRSVGETDDEVKSMDRLRWFEIESSEEGTSYIFKFSVPVKDVEAGNALFPSARTIWLSHNQFNSGMPGRIEPGSEWAARLKVFLSSAPQKKTDLEEKEFNSARQSYSCLGSSWEQSDTYPRYNLTFHWFLKCYSHEASPFGTVAFIVDSNPVRDGMPLPRILAEFILDETGTGAKSALPDNN